MSATAVVYSVVNFGRKHLDDGPQGEDNVYSEVKFPDSVSPQNVSHDGQAGTEQTGPRCHHYRLTEVCLGLLCLLLIISIIILSFALHRANQNGSAKENDLQQLTSKYGILGKEKDKIQEENNQLQQNCSSLTEDYVQLKKNYNSLSNEKNRLEQLENDYEAVLNISKVYCKTIETEKTCTLCPWGWRRFESSCYLISMEWNSWEASRVECQKLGAELVIIESKEEKNVIEKWTYGYRYWLGLKKKQNNWQWVDGTPLAAGLSVDSQFSYWSYNCAVASKQSWRPADCSSTAIWICETRALFKKIMSGKILQN